MVRSERWCFFDWKRDFRERKKKREREEVVGREQSAGAVFSIFLLITEILF